MAEYISRNELVENLDRFAPEHLAPLIKTLIEKQPTADVVEVVRCCDCKHYKPQATSKHWQCVKRYCCRSAIVKVKDNDFCSYGERK